MRILPLLATPAVGALATKALYSMPSFGQVVARDLKVNGTFVSGFGAAA